MTLRVKLLSFAAIAGAAATALGVGVFANAQSQGARLEWRVESRADRADEVDLTMTRRLDRGVHSFGRNVALATLQGLTPAQLHGQTQLAHFRLVRDAGTFVCEGQAGREQGSGTCDFTGSAAFTQRLSAGGFGAADEVQLLELAMSDVGGAYLDELKRQRYAQADVAGLVDAARHGVNLNYLQGMNAAGYRQGDLAALARLRDHGVDPRYIAALKTAGYAGLSTEEVTRMRDHGVSVDFITRMAALGYRPSADELVRLRDHGVSVAFVEELRELGYTNLSAEELTRLRDHGISASFIRRANADGPPMAPQDLIRMRDRGER